MIVFAMRLYVVRHAESENNAAGLNHSWSNPWLSPTWKMQAAQLAIAMFSKQIEIIFSSPAKRAADTTKQITRNNEYIRVVKDWRIKERGTGEIPRPRGTTHTLSESIQKQLKVELWQKVEWRIQEFLEELLENYGHYNRVCIVTHGGICAQLAALLEGKSVKTIDTEIAARQKGNHRFMNASITEYDITHKNWEIKDVERIRINDIQHMK